MKIEIRLEKLARQKAADENRDINIKTISDETGLARNTVADYWYDRVNRMDRRVLDTLCNYLNCTFSDLVADLEQEEESQESRVPLSLTFAH